jgi:hypothetical protein
MGEVLMTTYKGERSGETYSTTDGSEYSWRLTEEQVELNTKTSDGSNFESHFRFIWTGDYTIKDKVLKDYTHSHAVFDYRETYLAKQSSGRTGYSYGYALKFDTPVEGQFPLLPEQANSKVVYKYHTGEGTFSGELAKAPTSTNRANSIKNHSWSDRIKDGWWLTKNEIESATENLLIEPSQFNKKSADKITNFNPSTDSLEIDTDSFGIDSSATFAAGKNMKAVKKKLANKDFDFLYDEKKGGLYFNENGADKGYGEGGIIAILKGAPDLTSDNLEFI